MVERGDGRIVFVTSISSYTASVNRGEYCVSKAGLSIDKLKQESPTTGSWFDVAQVLAREGDDWNEFKSRFAGEAGIPLS